MFNSKAAVFFKNIKIYQDDITDDFEVPLNIKPKLLSYQRRAVKWMVRCEKDNKMITSNGSKFCGGILADEMGLGKTVEMLCCIMANTAPKEFYFKQIEVNDCETEVNSFSFSTPSTSKYVQYTSKKDLDERTKKCSRSMLNSWYNQVLNEMCTTSKNSKSEVQNSFGNSTFVGCYCLKTPPDSTLVFCAKCGKGQHAECVHFAPKPFQEVPYLCANCWIVNDKLPCKATLIVVPQSILNQWIDEIENHIKKPDLNIFVYNGVHSVGYIQPITFNDYDIVIMSYSNLSRDLNFVDDFDCENRNVTRFRHSKKYYYPKSPLPCIKWWRVCLDEGQAVENISCKVFEMTSCIESVNKWAITGTPVQKSLYDIFGILKFLDVSPYCVYKQFQQLMTGDTDYMYSWFSNIIWRNLIEDVNSELNLPEITHEQHILTLSQIEKHFYQTQHDDCASDFSNITTRVFSSLNISVKEIDKRTIYKIIAPLYKLRQACVHPQAVNGQFLKIKETMTMKMLMDVMIEKCRTECNDILRGLVSEHNALAGLYLIREEHVSAVEHYVVVLGLLKKYTDKKLKIDTCQRIHVMYNLASVLDEHSLVGVVSHDFNAVDMKNDMEQLEKEYLDSSKKNIESTRKTVIYYFNKISNLLGEKTVEYSEWWSDILDWIYSPPDFLTKVQSELEDYRVPGIPNIANRLKSINDVFNILGPWLSDLDSARKETISMLNILEETPMNDLVLAALACHLRLKSKKAAIKKRCLLCASEYQLQTYESLLFCVSNKQKHVSTDTSNEKDDEAMYESTSRGLWKMSQKEFLLAKLFQYGQAKIINTNCLKDGAEHMKILELVRKEFRYLRLLWTHLSDSLSAHDEIVMAKSRLRLGDTIKPESDENGPPNKKTKTDKENDVVLKQYVDYHIISLNSEIVMTEAKLEKQIGTLNFLENIKREKENSTEIESCPICCFTIDSGWAVLQCGHSVCNECLSTMCNLSKEAFELTCPLCRSNTPKDSVSYAKANRENEVPNSIIKGSFSTKIESITLKLLELIAEDPLIKIIIFSTWEKALSLLGEALDQNSINYRVLKNGKQYKKTLNDFKTNKKVNALLMKLSLGSKGLNLTEATRIFFMEPVINKADEFQAIGRIYRIGQTKPTYVHHFISRDTIEENIVKLFSADDQLHDWEDITLSQLIRVFERN